jgi:hypothetical protein
VRCTFCLQLFTEQEEAIADVLLSLSQVPSHSERTANKAIADSSNTNVASTSYSKGLSALFESFLIIILKRKYYDFRI